MIIFRKIRFKNFLSFGNSFTEIVLDKNPITVLIGANGSGKSCAILDTLNFALFGKSFRKINKNQLINTKNEKDAIVEVEFSINELNYKVVRGIKPDIFEVYINGMLQNQHGSTRDYQRYLQDTILRMDLITFNQIIMIGKATYVSFMKLDNSKRRKFVESILNLNVFSTMNSLHSQDITNVKNKLSELNNAVLVIQEKIKLKEKYILNLQNHIDSIESKEKDKIKLVIQSKTDELNTLQERLSGLSKHDLSETEDDIRKTQSMIRTFSKKKFALEQGIESLKNDLASLDDKEQRCRECHQVLDSSHIERITHKKTETLTKKENDLKELDIKLENAEDMLTRQQEQLQVMTAENAAYHQTYQEIKSLNRTIDQARNELNELSFDDYKQSIEEEQVKLNEFIGFSNKLNERVDLIKRKKKYYDLITALLKDNGIKSAIIKRFIPIINQIMAQKLSKLGFHAVFKLDENFDETILARGSQTLSYHNFSEGEKLRIDLAMILTWREIAAFQQNFTSNLLIMDEITDASLDFSGTEALSIMLEELNDSNIFLITHSPEKLNFTEVQYLRATKDKSGFSRIVTETEISH